ncbi:hypothetical protein KRX51_08335 [Corynebacterium sp. TAE3-ERU12]|nr:hypothetical protein [Corynebacterium sp. TAE3-ERU12]
MTAQAAFNNAAGPAFTLDLGDSAKLQRVLDDAPGVFLMVAGHTHRCKRTGGDAATTVDFVETAACKDYPGGYTLVHLYTGGYQVNFYRVDKQECLEWAARARWASFGFQPELTLGSLSDRSYVVPCDLSALG